MSDDPPDKTKNAGSVPPKKSLLEVFQDYGRDEFVGALRRPRVVICANGVVTYVIAATTTSRAAGHLMSPEATDNRIMELLAANPDIDFTSELQSALGITVKDFQRKAKPKPPEDDVLF